MEDSTVFNGNLNPFRAFSLLSNIPLESNSVITCVESWGDSIYIGTSNGEILHYFRVGYEVLQEVPVSSKSPPKTKSSPTGKTATSNYILASRQRAHQTKSRSVERILLLPSISRVLVFSNATISIFSLPELTPTSGVGRMKDVKDFSLDYDSTEHLTPTVPKNDGKSEKSVAITVFTNSVIRLVQVSEGSLKLLRDIDYPGVQAGLRRSNLVLVANSTNYDLIDIENVRKIPLFPYTSENVPVPEVELPVNSPIQAVSGDNQPEVELETSYIPEAVLKSSEKKIFQALKPIIVPVAEDEFLVTCGGPHTSDPAMGMLVNSEGDISRGTVSWSSYPTSVAVSYPYIVAVVDNRIIFHSLFDQTQVQSINYDVSEQSDERAKLTNMIDKSSSVDILMSEHNTPRLTSVANTFKVPLKSVRQFSRIPLIPRNTEDEKHRLLEEEERLKNPFVMESSLVVFSKSAEIQCLFSLPRVFQLEKMINTGKFSEVFDELEDFDLTLDTKSLEACYLNLLLGLSYVQKGKYEPAAAFKIWTSLQTDPRILAFILNKDSVFGDVWIHQGTFKVLSELEEKKSEPEFLSFSQLVIKDWLGRRDSLLNFPDRESVFKSLEVAYLRIILDQLNCDPNSKELRLQLYEFVQNEVFESQKESAEILASFSRYYALSKLYMKQGEVAEVCSIWQRILSKDYEEDFDFNHENGPELLKEYLLKCEIPEVVWAYGLWMVDKYPDHGIQVFVDPNRKIKFDSPSEQEKVATAIKSLKHNTSWQLYLEIQVKNGNMEFAGDLIMLKIESILQLIRTNSKYKNDIEETYSKYRALDIPKRPYVDFLETQVSIIDSRLPQLESSGITDISNGDQNRENESAKSDRQHPSKSKKKGLKWFKSKRPDGKPSGVSAGTVSMPYLNINSLRLNLINLLRQSDILYDSKEVIEALSQDREAFVMELAIVFSRSISYEEVIKILVHELGDYDTAVDYCQNGGALSYPREKEKEKIGGMKAGAILNEEIPLITSGPITSYTSLVHTRQKELFNILFGELLKISDKRRSKQVTENFLEIWGTNLDIEFVLNKIPNNWSIESIGEFLVFSLRKLTNEKNQSAMMKSLSRAENLAVSKQLGYLGSINEQATSEYLENNNVQTEDKVVDIGSAELIDMVNTKDDSSASAIRKLKTNTLIVPVNKNKIDDDDVGDDDVDLL
ncbi:hypothetical protein NADFUDRAFT_48956 [Nadsonia fulvescens var. elongata DSM 6958]|uniref:CNH domain-containing protein n=1 Tax=Nadsonia fulvescens var. elongata DSM 6958 TaxID=857566 RepID=A0A1E3PSB6_9ASCO|nr:hypothetical protein NADFUDRAFT_48956 [Nadsonia fulvescens var. elongata DSM 6958]